MSPLNAIESPLWRFGFYHCHNAIRLRVTDEQRLDLRKNHLDDVLSPSGLDPDKPRLKLIGQGVFRYSDDGAHGYTYFTGLMQSGAMIHTYPEPDYLSATLMIETCEPQEVMQSIIDDAVERLRLLYGAQVVLRRLPGDGQNLPLRSIDVPLVSVE
jgi:hypothetical protein